MSLLFPTVSASAIPDSEADQKLRHRWLLDDVNGTVEDSEGNADGTNNGIVSVDGNYAGGSAGDGDGSSYIETTTWGTFGSNMDSNFAIAFTIDPPASEHVILGTANSNGTTNNALNLRLDTAFGGSAGTLTFAIRGDENESGMPDNVSVESSTNLTSGGPYRVVINKTGNTASDIGIWVNQVDDGATTNNDDFDPTTAIDFNEPVCLFANNGRGTPTDFLDSIVDDICVFGNSLTQSEIESYENPWESGSTLYFASDGDSQPTHGVQAPQSRYAPSENSTFLTYQGPNLDPVVVEYDHDTGDFVGQTTVASNPYNNDDHGAPALEVTSDGTLHIWYGSHNDPQPYARSDNPYDTTSWTIASDIGSGLTYPKPVVASDDSIYLFAREARDGNNNRPEVVHTSTDGGGSWSDNGAIIDFGADTRIYVLGVDQNGDRVHLAWIYTDYDDTYRRHVYHMVYDMGTESAETIDGTSLTLPVDKTTADSECRVFDSGTEDTNFARVRLDENNDPHILFTHDNGGTWEHRYCKWDGSVWTSPTTITQSGHQFTSGNLLVNTSTDAKAYLVVSDGTDRSGDLEEWAYDGSSWSRTTIVRSEGDYGLNHPKITVPTRTDKLQMIFSESNANTYGNNDLKLFAYGNDSYL